MALPFVFRIALLLAFAATCSAFRKKRRSKTLSLQEDGLTASGHAAPKAAPIASKNIIRYGFRPNAAASLFLEQTMPIFDTSEGDSEQMEKLIETQVLEDFRESESLQEASRKAEVAVGLSGSYGVFSAAAEFSASSMSSSQTKTYRLDRTIEARKYRVSLKSSFHHRLLTPDAKEFLLAATPQRIAEVHGSFYATQVTLGGLLQVTQIAEMISGETKNTMKTKIEASYGIGNSISGSAEGSVEETSIDMDRSVSSKWRVLGGESLIWLGLKKDASNKEEIHRTWASTLSDQNLAILDIKVLPIWYLLDHDEMDVQKAQELKNYLTKKWKTEYDGLPLPGAKEKTCFCENGSGARGAECPTQGATKCVSRHGGYQLSGPTCHACTVHGRDQWHTGHHLPCCNGLSQSLMPCRGNDVCHYCFKPRAEVVNQPSCLVKPPPSSGWSWCYRDECDPAGNRNDRIGTDCWLQGKKSNAGRWHNCGDWTFATECY